MNYDIGLVRDIFKWCVKNIPAEDRSYEASDIDVPKYSKFQIIYHVKWLVDAGYIEALDMSAGNKLDYILESMTIPGYEYFAILKSKAGWKIASKLALEHGLPMLPEVVPQLVELAKSIKV